MSRTTWLTWAWPSIIILSANGVSLVTFVFTGTVVRPALVMWFLIVCPGMAVVRFFRLNQAATEWMLAPALSLAIDACIAGILLYAGWWSPVHILDILIGFCLCSAVVQLIVMHFGFPAFRLNRKQVKPIGEQNSLNEIYMRNHPLIRIKRKTMLLILLAVSIAVILPSIYQSCSQYPASPVTIDLSSPQMTSQFLPGATFIQLDNYLNNPREIQLMANGLGYLNTFIYGWGTDNPEPALGQYDWSSLDQRVQVMRQAKTRMIISLCCAPDWMKSDNNINTAPGPQNYAGFAQLSKQVAQRYPDVKYFQVWNELKGFEGNTSGYMQMYNMVYNAVKSVRPDALIGGPYIGMGPAGIPNPVVTQWLNTRQGGNFVAVDGGFDSNSPAQDFSGAQFYKDFASWLRRQPNGGATLPFGWAEWYPGTTTGWNDINHFNATMTNAMIYTLQSGASYALLWGVEGGVTGAYREGDGQQENLVDNGDPTPFYHSAQAFKDYFGPGTKIYKVTQSPPDVTVLASSAKTMLVNHLNATQTLNVNGKIVTLTPYQVLVINTPRG